MRGKTGTPKQRILLIDKLDYRPLGECFDKGYFVQRGLIDVSMENNKLTEMEMKELTELVIKRM